MIGFRGLPPRESNPLIASNFNHFPSLRTVQLKGEIPRQVIRAIFHPSSPIQTVNIFYLRLEGAHPRVILPTTSHVTHLAISDHKFFDVVAAGKGDKLFPRVGHLFLDLVDFRLLVATTGMETRLGFDNIHSLALGGAYLDIDSLFRWIKHLQERMANQNDPFYLKILYTHCGFLRTAKREYLPRLQSALEELECVGVEWIVQADFDLIPMKTLLLELDLLVYSI